MVRGQRQTRARGFHGEALGRCLRWDMAVVTLTLLRSGALTSVPELLSLRAGHPGITWAWKSQRPEFRRGEGDCPGWGWGFC